MGSAGKGLTVDGFAGDIGVRGEAAEDGRARLEFVAESWHLKSRRHGPWWCAGHVGGHRYGVAARSCTDDGDVPATSQLTIAYLTAAHEGLMAVTAQVRKQGDHLLVCDADVEQDGKPVVHAVATFAVL